MTGMGMLGRYGVLVGKPMQLTGENCDYVVCKYNREISVQIWATRKRR